MTDYRIEKDSMGELQVPADALYGAQTQRAINNFSISGLEMPAAFIKTVALIKQTAAKVNIDLELLDEAFNGYIPKRNQVALGMRPLVAEYLDMRLQRLKAAVPIS
jgi:fumarate hydratase class II